MTLRTIAAEPSILLLGDDVWRLEMMADGCAYITLKQGRTHVCGVSRVAELLMQARRMAAKHFGEGYSG